MGHAARQIVSSGYDVTVVQTNGDPSEWRVEAIEYEDGGCELALFSGPRAEERARGYARSQYGA